MVISFRLKEIPLYGESWNTAVPDLGHGGYGGGRAKFKFRPVAVGRASTKRTATCLKSRRFDGHWPKRGNAYRRTIPKVPRTPAKVLSLGRRCHA